MVGQPHRDRAARAARGSTLGEQLGHVAHLRREALGALGPLGLVAQHVAVVLHRRAAAGGVDHDRVVALERRDRRLGEAARSRRRRRAAAARRSSAARGARGPRSPRRRARAPWPRSRGRRTRAARSPGAGRPCRAARPRAAKRSGSRRSARRAEASGESASSVASRGASRRARGRAASFVRPSRCASAISGRRGAQPAGVGEEREHEPAVGALARRAPVTLRSTCARVSSISLSYCTPDGQAVTQAMQPRQLSMCSHERRRDLLVALLHQHDPPARRVHLLAPEPVGGAGGQAEAAVHAVVDQVERGRAGLVEGGHSEHPRGADAARGRSAP